MERNLSPAKVATFTRAKVATKKYPKFCASIKL